jgi:hypothetical protein
MCADAVQKTIFILQIDQSRGFVSGSALYFLRSDGSVRSERLPSQFISLHLDFRSSGQNDQSAQTFFGRPTVIISIHSIFSIFCVHIDILPMSAYNT